MLIARRSFRLAHDLHRYLCFKKVWTLLRRGSLAWPNLQRLYSESVDYDGYQRHRRGVERKSPVLPLLSTPLKKLAMDIMGPFERV